MDTLLQFFACSSSYAFLRKTRRRRHYRKTLLLYVVHTPMAFSDIHCISASAARSLKNNTKGGGGGGGGGGNRATFRGK